MKAKPLASLVKSLDRVFSKWVRLSGADEGGTVECFTCKKLMHWKDSHAGHFIKRQHMALRFDERNVKPQCPKCNVFMGGQQDEFIARLITEYGPEVVQDLMRLKHTTVKWTRDELSLRIKHYTKLVEYLEA